MNCTHIKRLIPLYVGGDLTTQEVAGVRKHIEMCEKCRGLVAEFEESQGWLRDFTAPQFDEAVFENLHASVREEIARVESRPSLFDLLTPVWNWRSVIAASSAVVLLTAGLWLYTGRPKSPDKQFTISSPPIVDRQNDAEIAGGTGTPSQTRRQKSTKNKRLRRSLNLPVIAINNHLAESELTIPTHSDLGTKQEANKDPDREMLRIEIQTADPNIRIIWIAPKESTR
jgi:Putative zinc-finger